MGSSLTRDLCGLLELALFDVSRDACIYDISLLLVDLFVLLK